MTEAEIAAAFRTIPDRDFRLILFTIEDTLPGVGGDTFGRNAAERHTRTHWARCAALELQAIAVRFSQDRAGDARLSDSEPA